MHRSSFISTHPFSPPTLTWGRTASREQLLSATLVALAVEGSVRVIPTLMYPSYSIVPSTNTLMLVAESSEPPFFFFFSTPRSSPEPPTGTVATLAVDHDADALPGPMMICAWGVAVKERGDHSVNELCQISTGTVYIIS